MASTTRRGGYERNPSPNVVFAERPSTNPGLAPQHSHTSQRANNVASNKDPKRDPSCTYISYDEMVAHIQESFSSPSSRRVHIELEDDCPVCLDPLKSSLEAVKTDCGHWFHPLCLHKSMSDTKKIACCPICRTTIQTACNEGIEWEILKFCATISASSQAAEKWHVYAMKELEASVGKVSKDCCAGSPRNEKDMKMTREKRMAETLELIHRMNHLKSFSYMNAVGFQNVVEMFDEYVGTNLSQEFKNKFVLDLSYAMDCGYDSQHADLQTKTRKSTSLASPNKLLSLLSEQLKLQETPQLLQGENIRLPPCEDKENAHPDPVINELAPSTPTFSGTTKGRLVELMQQTITVYNRLQEEQRLEIHKSNLEVLRQDKKRSLSRIFSSVLSKGLRCHAPKLNDFNG